jgi:predicted CopG family antitoxin
LRTTISIADSLYRAAKQLAGPRSFSEFASEALEARILSLTRERLAREMEEGYRSEAETSSLAAEWTAFEVEEME